MMDPNNPQDGDEPYEPLVVEPRVLTERGKVAATTYEGRKANNCDI